MTKLILADSVTMPKEENSLNDDILTGTGWVSFQLMSSQGTRILVKLILARLLVPGYFGIVGMAVVFTGLFEAIGDLGLAAALTQFKKERLTRIHLDTAFWLSVLFSGLIFLILTFGIAPFAVWFYGEPSLQSVIPVLGLSVLLSPLSLIHRILLIRELNFKPLSLMDVGASFGSGIIAVLLALGGAGVWSIVSHNILSFALAVPVFWWVTPWRPRLNFSGKAFSEILGLGIYESLKRILLFLTKNFDYLVVGKLLGAEMLGFYTLAFIFTDTFRQRIMSILNKVMFPVYSRLENDMSAIKAYYLRVIKYNTLIITPIMLYLVFFADPLIPYLVGATWGPMIFPVRAMAVACIIHTIGGTTDSLLKGIGRFDLNFKVYLINTFLVTIPAFVIGINFWGINGAALAVVIYKISSRIIYQYYIRKYVRVYETDILRALIPAVTGWMGTIPIIVISYTFIPYYNMLIFIGASTAFFLFYFLAIYTFRRRELKYILDQLYLNKAKAK